MHVSVCVASFSVKRINTSELGRVHFPCQLMDCSMKTAWWTFVSSCSPKCFRSFSKSGDNRISVVYCVWVAGQDRIIFASPAWRRDMKRTRGVPGWRRTAGRLLSPYLNELHCPRGARSFMSSRLLWGRKCVRVPRNVSLGAIARSHPCMCVRDRSPVCLLLDKYAHEKIALEAFMAL